MLVKCFVKEIRNGLENKFDLFLKNSNATKISIDFWNFSEHFYV